MKKQIFVLIVLSLLVSCKKRAVQLPNIPLDGIEDIQNHSSIWFFNKDGKLDLNEKNRISSTHWFFNIDKTLSLKAVLPEVIRLRKKHSEKSPHNTEIMDNYFSYANSIKKKLTFYQFDSITYKFIKKNEVKVNNEKVDTIFLSFSNAKFDFKTLNHSESKIIQAYFDASISFQTYLETKALLEKAVDKKQISLTEYIIE
jgi:hypothetical protein